MKQFFMSSGMHTKRWLLIFLAGISIAGLQSGCRCSPGKAALKKAIFTPGSVKFIITRPLEDR